MLGAQAREQVDRGRIEADGALACARVLETVVLLQFDHAHDRGVERSVKRKRTPPSMGSNRGLSRDATGSAT